MKSIDELLTGVKTVAISGHIRPDGDCTGSTLATYNYIKDNYPDIDVTLYLEPIHYYFEFLSRSDEIVHESDDDRIYDLFICHDCGSKDRLGPNAKYFESAKFKACIDHHVSNEGFADETYLFPEASSTCELVYELMDKNKITKEIAECLYVGMIHDTGIFQYSCTSSKTMKYAGELMDKGIDYSKIVDDTFYAKSFKENRALGHALDKAKLHLDGKVIASSFFITEMEEYGVTAADLDSIVSQMRYTRGIEVSVFMYEVAPGELKVSTRSNGKVNVAKIAMNHGGGGHARAAGFTNMKSYEEGLEEILQEIKEQL